MNRTNLAQTLRDFADRIDRQAFNEIPQQDLSLVEAVQILQEAIGPALCLKMEIAPANLVPVTFAVWDGQHHYCAPDLAAAVSAALVAQRTQSVTATSVEKAGKMLDGTYIPF